MQVLLIGRVQSGTLLAGMGENSIPSLHTLKYEGVGWVHKRVKLLLVANQTIVTYFNILETYSFL